jgi:hypothetical protein
MSIKLMSALCILFLFVLASCGKSSGGSNRGASAPTPVVQRPVTLPEEQKEEEKEDFGNYKVVLSPLNVPLAGSPFGEFNINVEKESVKVTGEMNGLYSGVRHFQVIHPNTTCPDEGADNNFDGVVDVNESRAVTGLDLVPLDSNLNSQYEGIHFGPISNEAGQYAYKRSAQYVAFYDDISALDFDPEDRFIKIGQGEKMKLSGRVLVIYGISENVAIPSTVGATGEFTAHQMLPIACGSIRRL